jgi:addiction module RelB/DinJ family antitoxin
MSTKDTILAVRIDRETKEAAQRIASELGVSLSHIVNMLIREFVANPHKFSGQYGIPNRKTPPTKRR